MSKKWTAADVQRLQGKGMTVNLGVLPERPGMRYVIGIDPGKHTGVAIWDRQARDFVDVTCMQIHQAFDLVKKYGLLQDVFIRVEDARQRQWFGESGREKLQGAGAAKRDATIWEDFLTDNKIPFELVAPKHNTTKQSGERFRKVTGWQQKTNGHGRDAGMLAFNY